ncbi:MAG TPA: RNA polymerase factor sigma-54 [Chloroflexia bacterium]|nr:RNA polymerase factor sigma-54 [Chloroflexia bacterium]
MDLTIGLSQEQQVRVSPSLIALNQILALSSQELQDEIRKELDSNPALELDERNVCPTCGSSYTGRVCQRCLAENPGAMASNRPIAERKSTSDEYNDSFDDYYVPDEGWSGGGGRGGDEEFDPITIVAAEMSLSERILMDLSAILDPNDMPIAEFLVGSLDERGYLSTTLDAVADTFSTEEEKVESILKEMQSVAPPGVGARDYRECLLIQLRYLKEQGIEEPNVKELIENFFTALGEHKYGYIAQQMGISVDDVHEARDFIKKYLNPFPAEGHTGEVNGMQMRSGQTRAGYVVPDVIISERDGQYEVEVVESKRFYLKVNSLYQRLSADSGKEGMASEQDREHVRQYVARAKFFMSNINQRRETMFKITKELVETQEEFLRDGVRGLKPLTRSMLASRIGIHESTVSRATAGKYVMLPNRKVIPYSDFFTASLSVKDVIKEIIETEGRNRAKPLTDQDIVELLEERGIRVARRTVAKYRAQLKILPSTLR